MRKIITYISRRIAAVLFLWAVFISVDYYTQNQILKENLDREQRELRELRESIALWQEKSDKEKLLEEARIRADDLKEKIETKEWELVELEKALDVIYQSYPIMKEDIKIELMERNEIVWWF